LVAATLQQVVIELAQLRSKDMAYRVLEWVDDESRSHGGMVYTVFEVTADGTEQEVLETRDRDEVENLVDGQECEWPEDDE
jgi:hypothetical protein